MVSVSVSPYKVYLPRQEQVRLLAGSLEKSEITIFMQKINFDTDILYEYGAIPCPSASLCPSLKGKRLTLRQILLIISTSLFLIALASQAEDVRLDRQDAALSKCKFNPA